jgi:hypothetical protein
LSTCACCTSAASGTTSYAATCDLAAWQHPLRGQVISLGRRQPSTKRPKLRCQGDQTLQESLLSGKCWNAWCSFTKPQRIPPEILPNPPAGAKNLPTALRPRQRIECFPYVQRREQYFPWKMIRGAIKGTRLVLVRLFARPGMLRPRHARLKIIAQQFHRRRAGEADPEEAVHRALLNLRS